jgi:hypothetical protein
MALIEYKIDLDANGDVTIVPTIKRLDPGDEIHLVTETPDAALQFNNESPFLPPDADKVHILRPAGAAPQPLRPAAPIDLSQELAQCGKADSSGTFIPWLQGKSGFPGVGNKSGAPADVPL